MGSVIILALAMLIVAARFCPDTWLGRHLNTIFVDGPARFLVRPDWKKAVPYGVVLVGIALMMLAMPELAPLAAGLDLSLMADLILATALLVTQLSLRGVSGAWRRLRQTALRLIRRAPRARRSRTVRRSRPARGDDDRPAWSYA